MLSTRASAILYSPDDKNMVEVDQFVKTILGFSIGVNFGFPKASVTPLKMIAYFPIILIDFIKSAS
jgi:hypothetical protein